MTSDPSLPMMSQSEVRKLLDNLEELREEREELKQRCHELENQVNLLQDEKSNMSAEYEQLQTQVAGKRGHDEPSLGVGDLRQQKEFKKQLETAQEDQQTD